jgi:aminopeptidase YwaD
MRASCLLFLPFLCLRAAAQEPFLTSSQWKAIGMESSGVAPYENLRYLTGLHRVPGTPAFEQAAQFIVERAREYGLDDAHSEEFPIDGIRTYGLMRSYLAWSVQAGRLWEVRPRHLLLGDAKADPIRLADYSHSASLETSLVDVGEGTSASDYNGKNVRGKIVLAGGFLIRVQQLAIAEHGAAGILSDMPNQTTAWSGLDPTLVRWGHLDARQPVGFAFMIARQTADLLRARLAAHEDIVLKADVKATVGPGHWTVDTATIAGTDSSAGQVVFTCHLDHERPGANDDGSGCVDILEVARTLNQLIHSGALPRPKRTIRFIWGPEHEGTMAFLAMHPEIMKDLRVDIHMDMVGGDPFKNKSIMHVTETPWSLPSFVTDVGSVFLDAIRTSASAYAGSGGSPEEALVETRSIAAGTRNEFLADVTPFEEGSDHDDYDSSMIAVPSLYLRDWPDIFIHTDHDSLEQIDATKLRRVATLGAAAGYVYANLDAGQVSMLLPFFTAQCEGRLAKTFIRAQRLLNDSALSPEVAWYEARNLLTQSVRRESEVLHSFVVFCAGPANGEAEGVRALVSQATSLNTWLDSQAKARGAKALVPPWDANAAARLIPVRIAPFGPVENQNDNALLARLGPERYGKIKLSGLYAYEVLNFVNGKRTIGEIRDAVSAEYGPVDIELVSEYLKALDEAKIVKMN